MRWIAGLAIAVILLDVTPVSAAPSVNLVADLVPGSEGSHIMEMTPFGNGAAFARWDLRAGGFELWRSDGTTEGTFLVKDLPTAEVLDELTAVSNTLFFSIIDSVARSQLWKSDGTEAGTVLVKDISEVSACSPDWLTAVDDALFLNTGDETTGQELWRSDGTESGTGMVKDIWPGPDRFPTWDEFCQYGPRWLTDVGGTLFFTTDDGSHGSELWKSDGTAAGTVMVKDIWPGTYWGGSNGSCPWGLVAANGLLFFEATDEAHGTELWVSDGTVTGTLIVEDIRPGPDSSVSYTCDGVAPVVLGDSVYFPARDGVHGTELWRSDGTEDGTVMVKDIVEGKPPSSPEPLASLGSTLMFSAYDHVHGRELWRTDGTADGTWMVKDLRAGPGSGLGSWGLYRRIASVGGTLYFVGDDRTHGAELWGSDGTEAGTVMLRDLRRGTKGSNPYLLVSLSEGVLFVAKGNATGRELWRTEAFR